MAERLTSLEKFLIDKVSSRYISGHNEIYAGALQQLLHAYANNSLSPKDSIVEWSKQKVKSITHEDFDDMNYSDDALRHKRNVLSALQAISAYLR